MKKLLILLVALTAIGCAESKTREVEASAEEQGRITITHVKNTGLVTLYIAKIDSSEFLITDKGWITKIK